MPLCAFLTMDSLEDFFTYDELLLDPLAEFNWEVEFVSWRAKNIDWSRFDAVIIRSPWDYQDEPNVFLEVLETIDRADTHLENKMELVRWNISKTYLQDMQSKGIPIIPTLWPGTWKDIDNPDIFFEQLRTSEIIIKPVISANADHTYRLKKETMLNKRSELSRIFKNKPFMVQPFLKSIIEEGEFSLFYFGEQYSHAILKKPGEEDFRVQEEHGGSLHSLRPSEKLRSISDATLRHIHPLPLYSRLDFALLDDGSFALMELELIEPSLYFNLDPESPQRFAKVFNRWMQNLK